MTKIPPHVHRRRQQLRLKELKKAASKGRTKAVKGAKPGHDVGHKTVDEIEHADEGTMDEAMQLAKDDQVARDRVYQQDEDKKGVDDPDADEEPQEADDTKKDEPKVAKGKEANDAKKGAAGDKLAPGKKLLTAKELEQALDKIHAQVQVVEKAPTRLMVPLRMRPTDNAFAAMKDAKDPGTFFRIFEDGSTGHGGAKADIDPALLKAVEEARRLLANVKGVNPKAIGPGEDEEKNPVVVVPVSRGFTQASLRQVPEKVLDFGTLIAIPYELLPLKRDLG